MGRPRCETLPLAQEGDPDNPTTHQADGSRGPDSPRRGMEERMSHTPLGRFVDKILASRRLLFADLRRLERDVLPEGPASREEAEALLALDRALAQADRAWTPYLAAAIAGFAGRAAAAGEDAAWLAAALDEARPPTAAAIARALAGAGDAPARAAPARRWARCTGCPAEAAPEAAPAG
jgi:hypothetical protein